MKVYLGGQITGLTFDEARQWRLHATAKLEEYGITALDPLREKEHLASSDVLTPWFDGGSEAVQRDLWDIRRSDIVLLNFENCDHRSIGTCAEMGYAFSSGCAEIVVVRNTETYDHVFVDYMADRTFDHLRGALEYIIARRPIADPEAGRGIHGVELQDGAEGYRGWLTGSDQAPQPVEDQPLRRAEVDGGRSERTARDRYVHSRGGW